MIITDQKISETTPYTMPRAPTTTAARTVSRAPVPDEVPDAGFICVLSSLVLPAVPDLIWHGAVGSDARPAETRAKEIRVKDAVTRRGDKLWCSRASAAPEVGGGPIPV